MVRARRMLCIGVLVAGLGGAGARGQEWTRFRGPDGTGIGRADGIGASISEKDYTWKDPEDVEEEFEAILESTRESRPDARIDGIMIQPMERRGLEVIVGGVVVVLTAVDPVQATGNSVTESTNDKAINTMIFFIFSSLLVFFLY